MARSRISAGDVTELDQVRGLRPDLYALLIRAYKQMIARVEAGQPMLHESPN